MLRKIIKPKFLYDLERLGSNNDGGYLVEKGSLENSLYLLSFGIGHNWKFEKDFYERTKIPIYCYDKTISYSSIKKFSLKKFVSYLFRIFKPKYFLKKGFFKEMIENIFLFYDYKKFFKGNIKHIEKNIGLGKDSLYLNNIFNELDIEKCFIKIDIEGSEYRILNELIEYQDKISGLIIEFHDVDLHLESIYNFIEKIKLDLVHVHPQNPAPVINNIPSQLEITFSDSPKKIPGKITFPHKLDHPANPNFKDIELKFKEY